MESLKRRRKQQQQKLILITLGIIFIRFLRGMFLMSSFHTVYSQNVMKVQAKMEKKWERANEVARRAIERQRAR